ncbi:MAG: ABC transporter permease [Gemmatimonadaceae bacterium]
MRIARNLRLSRGALFAHRARTALAVAGTAIGVGGVLVLTAIGEGAKREVVEQIDGLGRNMLVVTAAQVDARAGRARQGEGLVRTLRVDDAAAVLRGTSTVLRAAPAQDRGMVAKYGQVANPTTVVGTTPDWFAIRQLPLAEGRFFTGAENAERARIAVLGREARESLFPDSVTPVGRTIRIGRVPFEVVGVLASKGVSVDGTATEDDRIIVPLETAMRRLFNIEYLKMIYLEAADASSMSDAEQQVASILRARHGVLDGGRDDFLIQNQRVLLAAELATQRSFQRLIVGLGFLSLLVGGVGILSLMLLSIRERRAEIGLRVAVGARRTDVVAQFLAEALLLAGTGGAGGILLGIGLSKIVSSATEWNAHVSPATLALAIGSVAAIGVCSGVFPAWRAAALDPVDALRAE